MNDPFDALDVGNLKGGMLIFQALANFKIRQT
jgi:hypothetical protein